MTMASTAISSRKRKLTDDMEESPPKRQTRARAAKAAETTTISGPKPTRITTASARIAAQAKATATGSTSRPTIASTRRTRAADIKAESSSKATGPPKPRIRAQKAVRDSTPAPAKSRLRPTKAVDSTVISNDRPKTCVRNTKVDDKPTATEPTITRTTRARSNTMTSEADMAVAQPVVKKVVKRVTFKEDLIDEKENQPIAATKKEPAKPVGIRARPVRQPAKVKVPARGKISASQKAEEKLVPLSPRKITQVAKTTSGSVDEPVQAPLKKILKSPLQVVVEKQTTSTLKSQTAAKAAAVESETEALLASPAKRPPPSPFKDALIQSPRKFALPSLMPDLSQNDDQSATQERLKMSPRKMGLTPMRLRQEDSSEPTTRAALLSSPARRPNSPIKLGTFRSPEKADIAGSVMNTTSIIRHVNDDSLLLATPRKLFGSPTKARHRLASPIRMPELVEAESCEKTVCANDPTISKAQMQVTPGFRKYSKPVQFGKTNEVFEHDVFEDSGHYRSAESGSEDELTLGSYISSPSKTPSFASRFATSPSGQSPVLKSAQKSLTPKSVAKSQFMTPLAIQFSNWLATSPTKSDSEEGSTTEIYTPVAEVVHNRNIARRVAVTPAANPTFFEDQLPALQVMATPEESMQTLDLHTSEDLEMVDHILSDVDVVAATPENSFQAIHMDEPIDVDMAPLDTIDIMKESLELMHGVPEELAPVMEVEDAFASDPFRPETIQEAIGIDDNNCSSLEQVAEQGSSIVDEEATLHAITTDSLSEAELPHPAHHSESQDLSLLIAQEDIDAASTEQGPLALESLATEISSNDDSSPSIETYGDENTAPQPEEQVSSVTQVKSLQTPVRVIRTRTKEIRTVARVPLKPASDDSPIQLKLRKCRSKSLSTPLSELELDDSILFPKDQSVPATNFSIRSPPMSEQKSLKTPRSVSQPLKVPVVAAEDIISLAESPFKSDRNGPDAQILRGAVVHVDVHTSEGADASGIFVELLTQMGARCVKQWNWNPRSTLGGGEDLSVNSKVGITHVIFKDGSKRTLQKVREAKGLVLCVGVGWVLDCERANRWLDEAPFAVDTSTIPRGGRNRRKSMEPTMLANMGGNLVPVATPSKSTRKSLRLSKGLDSGSEAGGDADETVLLPFTPGRDTTGNVELPETPLAVKPDANLVQQTCPPKKSQQMLFPLSGNLEDQSDVHIREKLAKARRKTLGWAPKVASPLAQAISDKE